MPPRKKPTPSGPTPSGPTPVESWRHGDTRSNIPTGELRDFVADDERRPAEVRYPRDPSLDPQLVWRGKDEQDSEDLVVPSVPIYIQEKVVPRALVENLRRTAQRPEDEPERSLFDDFDGFDGIDSFEQKVDFYHHGANWSNRMILGDSLLAMTSLAEKEALRGKVQMIYLDPPYGIKFGSNWQVSTRKREVTDGKTTDATRQPEQIRAFRDTWKLGIHSYLSYLRDRLAVARELLTESGSIFVQIGDQNVHLVRAVLDEVFGSENFGGQISFAKTSSATDEHLSSVSDYLLWYAKDVDRLKYRQLYLTKEVGGLGGSEYTLVETFEGRRLSASQALAEGSTGRAFRLDNLTSQSMGREKGEGAASWFGVEIGGKVFKPSLQSRWKTNQAGMSRLVAANRVVARLNSLSYVRYLDDFPVLSLNSTWSDTAIAGRPGDKTYVVQTSTKVIERCLLMSTDPGDLVLDPTCGSGTTAYVAEQWGRRWITTDTSRVALALARTRLMSAKLPYYLLADSPDGVRKEADIGQQRPTTAATAGDVRKGFVHKRVPHVTLKSIANNPDIVEGMSREQIDAAIAKHAETELLLDQPYEDVRRIRVAGPFTVESLAPHRVLSTDEDRPASEDAAQQPGTTSYEQTILDNLRKAGVQNGRKAERLTFDRLEPFAGQWVQAAGEYLDSDGESRRVGVSLGPQYGTVGPDQVKEAAKEALKGVGFDVLLVCGFAFDPSADATALEFAPVGDGADSFAQAQAQQRFGRLPVLLVRMNPDLSMGDTLLKSTGAGNLFTVFGEPDIDITARAEELTVEIRGVDVYDPTTGAVRASSTDDIALWMIDTAYDGESFFVRHAYFTGADDPYKRLKRALRADIDEAAWATLNATVSRPFTRPASGRIAVKVINHYGDEVLKVYPV